MLIMDKWLGVLISSFLLQLKGTDTNGFAGFRACKCLDNFYRTHWFEGCQPCTQPGLQCVQDFATLQSGYWWKWRNETDKNIYKNFTSGAVDADVTPVVLTKSSMSNGTYIEYPHNLPQPQKCPREKSCMGGLDASCAVGYEGPLCEICSAGYYKQLKTCQKCPTKKWMIGQLSILTAVVLVVVALLVWTSKKKRKKNEERPTVDIILGRLKFAIGFYSTCLKTANVLPLACHTICVDEEDENCERFLRADYSVECTNSEFKRSVIVAFCTIAYIAFLPTASLIILWRHKSYLKQQQSQNLNFKSREVLTGLRFLFENYSEQTWYWELVETIRKVVLTSGLILVGSESRAYVGLACVISGLYGMFFAYKRPVMDPFEEKLMLSSLGVTFVNLGIGAVSRIPKEGLPASVNPYLDNIIFNALLFGANSLVIGLLFVQYSMHIYRYFNTWRKNPKLSFSCCLALLLPLNELQGEVRGLSGKSFTQQQLQTGKNDMPSMSSALKDSGTINFSLEGEERNDNKTTKEYRRRN